MNSNLLIHGDDERLLLEKRCRVTRVTIQVEVTVGDTLLTDSIQAQTFVDPMNFKGHLPLKEMNKQVPEILMGLYEALAAKYKLP